MKKLVELTQTTASDTIDNEPKTHKCNWSYMYIINGKEVHTMLTFFVSEKQYNQFNQTDSLGVL